MSKPQVRFKIRFQKIGKDGEVKDRKALQRISIDDGVQAVQNEVRAH